MSFIDTREAARAAQIELWC
jgi:hypothetical protein